MGKLAQRLKDASKSGVYRATLAEVVEAAAHEAGADYGYVALHGVNGKTDLMKSLAAQLALPSWFGANWDALEDCLSDLSWRAGEGHVLSLAGWEALPGDDLGILIDVLASSADFWTGRGTPFFAVLLDPQRRLGLPDLYRDS